MQDAHEIESVISEAPFLDLRLEQTEPVPAVWRERERWQPRWAILFSLLAALLLWAAIGALIL